MKKITIILVFAFNTVFAFSQGSLRSGKVQFNGGVGFSNWGIPLSLGLDYGIGNNISLGAEVTYRVNRSSYGYYSGYYDNLYSDYRQTMIGITTNGNYHFNELIKVIPKKVDLYAGLNLGYYIINNKYDNNFDNSFYVDSNNASGLGFGLQTGGRYFFNNNFGVNVEFTGGRLVNSELFGGKVGITYRFGKGKSSSQSSSESNKKATSNSSSKNESKTSTTTSSKSATTKAPKPSTKTTTAAPKSSSKTTTKKKVTTKKK